ncbi:MAG TPA: ATP-binding cassette domain-containing protein [Jiangellaceae bacterium]
MNRPGLAIAAEGVRKHYAKGPEGAGLNGFDLHVPAGSVYGLLGPNGSGKTTAIRILSTLLRLDAGRAEVAGFDVSTQPRQVRERIGLVGQYAAVDEILTGRQNLVMFARLNHLSGGDSAARADELLERFGLAHAAGQSVETYSGGMRRRLDLAASLIVAPAVLFVDEPTTGLDPGSRQEVWAAIRDLVARGTTVLLTTQYLEEADRLAARIALLRAGRVIAEGTPDELKAAEGGDWLDIVLADAADAAAARPIAARVSTGELIADEVDHRISVPVDDRTAALIDVATAVRDAGLVPLDITLRRPTLDEVFLHLTGAGPADATGPNTTGRGSTGRRSAGPGATHITATEASA